MFGIKDLDFYLAKFLDDSSILNLSKSNSRNLKRYDDSFFKQRFTYKYSSKTTTPESYGKKDYCQDLVCMKNWESVIEKDKVHLVPLVEIVDNFRAIERAIIYDSIQCFKKYFIRSYGRYFLSLAIQHRSNKILNHLKSFNLLIYPVDFCIDALKSDCNTYVSMIPPVVINHEWVENLCYSFCYCCKDWVVDWSLNYNESVDILLKKIPEKLLNEIRMMSLARDCHYVIKMIIQYKSKFGSFYSK